MKVQEYKGKAITVQYDPKRCIHARECVHGAPEVFDPNAKPWVEPDKAEAKAIAAVIKRCPTGALHYQATDPALTERAEPSNTLTITPNGPLYLRGSFVVVSDDEKELLSDTRAALCRCGGSKNKPFCDNSHFAVAFDDSGTAAPGVDAGKEMATSGRLRVMPTRNGPLHLQGQLTVRNAANQVIFEGTETWLCRCGASASKPFCDGSHERIGFRVE
ncbi:MAG: CDGSH iron-sulfur domain-containing protein [Terriglobales bacterium]